MTQRTAWILGAACLAGLSIGCGGKASGKAEAATRPPARNPLEITAGPELMRQIKVGEVPRQEVAAALKLAGRVEADETRMARVSSPVTGRVVDLNVAEGEMVKRGDI